MRVFVMACLACGMNRSHGGHPGNHGRLRPPVEDEPAEGSRARNDFRHAVFLRRKQLLDQFNEKPPSCPEPLGKPTGRVATDPPLNAEPRPPPDSEPLMAGAHYFYADDVVLSTFKGSG